MASNGPRQLTEQERAADKVICAIDRRFNIVRLLTPTNLHTEQERFFAGKIKNPSFTYRKPEADFPALINEIESLAIPSSPIGKLLQKKATEMIAKLHMVMSIGSDAFSQYSKEIYGVPDKSIVDDALELMKTSNPMQPKDPVKQPRLTSEAVAHDLRDVLLQYGLTDWQVELTDDIISGVIVSPSHKSIQVHAHTSLELSRLAPIITHEIETHVLTTVNGSEQPLEIFIQGFAGYIRTQEGLASYNVEWRHPELFHRPARFWSRNALAVDLSLRGSFRDVYEYMRELGFNEHFSYGVGAKVKRGLTDTSQPGGFTKDYLYLAGRRDITNYVAMGGDLKDLYVGKILLEDLPLLKKQPWLKKPKVLPRFLLESASGPESKRLRQK